jgi:hypothetical protein
LQYSPPIVDESNLGFKISGSQTTIGLVNSPSNSTLITYRYTSIDLPVGIWLVESSICTSALVNGCYTMAYLCLSTSSTNINNENCIFVNIPLDSNFNYYNKLTATFTITENTTIYTLITVFNCRDANGNPSQQQFTLEKSPSIIATRIA